MDELYFDGDPATDSTRRRLERVLKEERRSNWGWIAALAAGSTALLFWQMWKRRRNGNDTSQQISHNPQLTNSQPPK